MYRSETKIRVRYGETDQMGAVYYGNYALYYEVARVESLRQLGLTYRALEESGVMLPVVENKSRYIAPAKYDDLLRVVTTILEMPGVKIKFDYEIFNEAETLINKGETVLVFIDMKTNKPCRPPEIMKNLLKPFFG
jgi:acyl-CoA thioester hydrolase